MKRNQSKPTLAEGARHDTTYGVQTTADTSTDRTVKSASEQLAIIRDVQQATDGRGMVCTLVVVALVGIASREKEKKRHQTKVIDGTSCHDLRDSVGGLDGSLELATHLGVRLRLKTRLPSGVLRLQADGGLTDNLLACRLGCSLEDVVE